jgi:hypothetical protein
MTALKMHHDVDPKKLIIDKVGDISDATVMHNEILVGVYIRPASYMSEHGNLIHLPDNFREEDKFQGKVGLVLAKGPAAFVSDGNFNFNDQDVKIHDWIVCHSGDGWSLTIRGQLCRMVKDNAVRMIVPTPDYVY